ncbi:MAG TPA: PIN domain-containing protein [bacterium]|nr:PIN domain-containing protein [bacterium]
MNVLLVDTSVWIDFFRGQSFPELELALKEGRVVLSPIVLAELISGVHNKNEEKQLAEFLHELPLHATPEEHWIAVGRLRHQAASHGISMSIPDAHIAQCARDLEGYLLTRDQIFQKVAAIGAVKLHG